MFDKKTAKRLFYHSDDQTDKIRAIQMAAPYFTTNREAATIITNGACGRCGCETDAIQDAGLVIYQSLCRYIDKLIHKNFQTFLCTGSRELNLENRQEMHSCAMIKILETAGRYSGKRALPITYFERGINFGLSEYAASVYGVERSESKRRRLIKTAIKEIEAEAGEISVESVRKHIKSDMYMSDAAIKRGLFESTPVSLEDCVNISKNEKTPEEKVIAAEQSGRLRKGMATLSEAERLCICLSLGINPFTLELTYRAKPRNKISQALKMSEEDVRRQIESGGNKLRRYYSEIPGMEFLCG